MKTQRILTKACCGGRTFILKLDKIVSRDFLPLLTNSGYIENTNFSKAGILYMENSNLQISGTFGQDKLQLKCKNVSECDRETVKFEELLQKME